jgi:hypothetical protein
VGRHNCKGLSQSILSQSFPCPCGPRGLILTWEAGGLCFRLVCVWESPFSLLGPSFLICGKGWYGF